MPIDMETKKHLQQLQDEAIEVLSDLADIFPPDYCLTLVARHHQNIDDADIVLTNDNVDDAISALERNKIKMENAS